SRPARAPGRGRGRWRPPASFRGRVSDHGRRPRPVPVRALTSLTGRRTRISSGPSPQGGAMKPAVERLLDRRSFFTTMGKAAAGASAFGLVTDADLEAAPQNVQKNSIPSQLK